MSFPNMAGANCPLRLCDQGVTGRDPHPSFRARIVVRGAQTATRRLVTGSYCLNSDQHTILPANDMADFTYRYPIPVPVPVLVLVFSAL